MCTLIILYFLLFFLVIQAMCSDGKTVSPVYGGPGGMHYGNGSDFGFDTAEGETGKYLDFLTISNERVGNPGHTDGSKNPAMDPGLKKPLNVKCNPGDVIVGIKGSQNPKFFVEDTAKKIKNCLLRKE